MKRIQFFVILLACMLLVPSLAMGFKQKDGAPVIIEPKPEIATPGKPITLTGHTTPDGQRFEVVLQITIPGQSNPQTIKTKCDQKGDFKVVFNQTDKTGTYKISATAPDGKGTGSAEFKVVTPSGIGDLATGKFEELGQALKEKADHINKQIDQLPASSERDELVQKTNELVSKINEINQQAAKIKPSLDKMLEAIEGLPPDKLDDQPAMEIIEDLAEWTVEADQQMAKLKNLLPEEKQDQSICDMIHAAGEGMRLCSTMMNFIGSGTTIIMNLAVDKAMPAMLNKFYPKRHPGWDFGAKGAIAAAQGMDDFKTGLVGLLNDAITLLTDELLKRYCGEYSGPIKATMKADFKHQGQSYWKYSISIQGQFTVRFAKNSPAGKPIRLTGEIFGNATKYTFWEDVQKVMEVPRGGQIIVRQPIIPGPFPPLYKDSLGFGKIANPGPAHDVLHTPGRANGRRQGGVENHGPEKGDQRFPA
jgi:predicted transcriptional regulator